MEHSCSIDYTLFRALERAAHAHAHAHSPLQSHAALIATAGHGAKNTPWLGAGPSAEA